MNNVDWKLWWLLDCHAKKLRVTINRQKKEINALEDERLELITHYDLYRKAAATLSRLGEPECEGVNKIANKYKSKLAHNKFERKLMAEQQRTDKRLIIKLIKLATEHYY